VTPIEKGHRAYCPRCNTQLYRGGSASLSGNLALTITCLLLFIPCFGYSYIHITLFGMDIQASFPRSIQTLIDENYLPVAILVLFCGVLAPLIACFSLITAHFALSRRHFTLLNRSLNVVYALKHWVMIDVFLVSIAISCFKLRDNAEIFVSPPLYGLLLLQILSVTLVSRFSVHRYWESWKAETSYQFETKDIHCAHCHLSQPAGTNCVRCHHPLNNDSKMCVQKTWAYLLVAAICLVPANWFPISILITNGQRLEDTIFSGVISLMNSGMTGIAVIIFVASILVPVIKIIGLTYLLLAVQFDVRRFRRQRMVIYFILKWIGKWSMIDLFVISIMLTLVDRDQVLDFTPGHGAVAFGFVVVFTMLATDSFDPKIIWENNIDQTD
jgi:paraquat-inducible protein A